MTYEDLPPSLVFPGFFSSRNSRRKSKLERSMCNQSGRKRWVTSTTLNFRTGTCEFTSFYSRGRTSQALSSPFRCRTAKPLPPPLRKSHRYWMTSLSTTRETEIESARKGLGDSGCGAGTSQNSGLAVHRAEEHAAALIDGHASAGGVEFRALRVNVECGLLDQLRVML